MMTHEDALNEIIACTCPYEYFLADGTPIHDTTDPALMAQEDHRSFRLELHCDEAIVKARLTATHPKITYEILSLEFV
jgi:hypothetical protein